MAVRARFAVFTQYILRVDQPISEMGENLIRGVRVCCGEDSDMRLSHHKFGLCSNPLL
jgi:hypothetical protein